MSDIHPTAIIHPDAELGDELGDQYDRIDSECLLSKIRIQRRCYEMGHVSSDNHAKIVL